MAEGFHANEDEEILRQVLLLANDSDDAPRTAKGNLYPAFESLVHQIVYYATGEDRNWDEPASLLSRANAIWNSGETRQGERSIVNLRLNQTDDWRTSRLVLEITTDDKPFLVDSISSALSDAGKPVSFFVNAVVDVHRDAAGNRSTADTGRPVRESLIRAEMEPPVDESEIQDLETEIRQVLDDVALAVEDWEPMRARLAACIAQLERSRPVGVDREDLRESIDFLKWLWDNRFAFLGVRRYTYSDDGDAPVFERDETGDLGIAKDPEKRILKGTYLQDGAPAPTVLDFMRSSEPLLVAKANTKSTVHRRVHMDYIGVKIYSVDGKVIGEERFVGLFTADAYNRPASDIPLLRAKVRRVAEDAGFIPGSHNEKAIQNILETFPRDEMFQGDVTSLREHALGVLRLYKRPRTKLFLRRDRFDRFISALVFIPRDRFSSSVRQSIGAVLEDAFDGWIAAFNPHFGDASLVRVHFIIGIEPGAPEGPGVMELTYKLREITRSWADDLLDEMRVENAGATPRGLFSKYESAFDAGYVERNSPETALKDIAVIERMGKTRIALRAYRSSEEPNAAVNIKLYCKRAPFRLSDMIPTMENLGLSVLQEHGYSVKGAKAAPGETVWINDFWTKEQHDRAIDLEAIKKNLEDTFLAVLNGEAEDDGFNTLVLVAGLTWREAAVMRAGARYALQTGVPASQTYIEETLSKHPVISRALINIFHTRFNPAGSTSIETREGEVNEAARRVTDLLQEVESLDEDRIIRRFLNQFLAMTRTNYYQSDSKGRAKPYISFKIDTKELAEVPDPKPFREIFVSGPRVDGVHLRFGPVARGGLRWSDRREDFRTEVLGLVKAQRVKNAVIVPAGSKGCFYPKQLPKTGDRAAIYEEGRAAYIDFIRGLLDLTDNIVGGKTVAPKNVVSWDAADPYLVVAADKGTAAFSDTANGVSADYGFWLGDAFASGGSAGYDHKAMGITARGAWESVKRHFREMGKDIQSEPFTVAGVGDMSGDVFGNGMLLSNQIKLIAAFDHRDIFVDPNPDPAKSFEERKRLFELPRSSWQDYTKELISKGGGVFSRSAKSIAVSDEMRAVLGVDDKKLTPNELIRAILKSQVELFWLGGIGTYFKASSEENWRVGDRTNDSVRINAEEMRMSVIGEGANLGLTQKARIAFARNGGRANTDAIDNSAGVDSSDHEVNIKILLSSAIEKGELKSEDRDELLKEMTDEVARLVLVHNYDQTRALTQMHKDAARDLDVHSRMMAQLEMEDRLDRDLEDLPDEKRLFNLRNNNEGLSRPELSVLLAYAKMQLFDELVASDAPDDPALEQELFNYFPSQLREFADPMVQHRLRREIIATRLSNEIINTCGATFAQRAAEATGSSLPQIALAYEGARKILHLNDFAAAVDNLDNKVDAGVQIDLYSAASKLLSEQVYQLLLDVDSSDILAKEGVAGIESRYASLVDELKNSIPSVLSHAGSSALAEGVQSWVDRGTPQEIAETAALLPALQFAFPIINLSQKTQWSATGAAALFFAIGDALKIERTRFDARSLKLDQHYDRMAMRRLTDNLTLQQALLTQNAMIAAGDEPEGPAAEWAGQILSEWLESHDQTVVQLEDYTDGLELGSSIGVGKITLFGQKLAEFVERTRKRD